MISVTSVNSAALSSASVNVNASPTPVARPVDQSTSRQGRDIGVQQPSVQQVQRAVAQANARIAGLNEKLSFGFVKELGQLVVQVTDTESGDVIRQFPSKEFIAQAIAAKASLGMLLDKQV